jgi:putative membrane protein
MNLKKIAEVLTALVALLHLSFMFLEMFLWQTDFGLKAFDMTPTVAENSAVLAKNQGLYNGFLAAGLIWSFFIQDSRFQRSIRTFFLVCILIAGLFGAATAKPSIIFIQALPALLALIAVRFSK